MQIVTAYDLDDPAQAKPHPYSGLKILETQNVKSENTIMVGDAQNDVGLARAINAEPVVVLTGHLTERQAMDLKVKYVINNVTQLDEVLVSL